MAGADSMSENRGVAMTDNTDPVALARAWLEHERDPYRSKAHRDACPGIVAGLLAEIERLRGEQR